MGQLRGSKSIALLSREPNGNALVHPKTGKAWTKDNDILQWTDNWTK